MRPVRCKTEAEHMKIQSPKFPKQEESRLLVLEMSFREVSDLLMKNASTEWKSSELQQLKNLLGLQRQFYTTCVQLPVVSSDNDEVENWSAFWSSLDDFLSEEGEMRPVRCKTAAENMKIQSPKFPKQEESRLLVLEMSFREVSDLLMKNASTEWKSSELQQLKNLLGLQRQFYTTCVQLPVVSSDHAEVENWSAFWSSLADFLSAELWERVVEARLRKVVEICEQQYGFMPRKSTTDAIFALRILMEKYRDGQRELHCVFVDLEKAYDRVPREELWYCMRKSGVAEKYVRVVQDMYERSRTVVRCAVGQTEEFNVEVGLHQGSALSPFLFAIVMDQLSEEVRQESPWTMMFADDIVICSESREQVEENLERWRFALERRGMKVSRSKPEYMCVNEREGSGRVRLQGEEVKKVQEFKYLGSTVQSNGECGKEVKKRVQAGWNGWRKVSGVLCDRKISARIKGKEYRTVVRPAMLYGLEKLFGSDKVGQD
ncbi:hypothetical protein QTP86_008594 [Hemibagrus guttatus]|nr:hypothetical protein QTP86_008594 [Hemibagrus guttatus]